MIRFLVLLLFISFSLHAEDLVHWHQHPYETPNDHIKRLESLASAENEAIDLLEEELACLLQKKTSILEKISRLQGQKEKLESTFLKEPSPFTPSPFTLHLVRPGDTLYRLALHYYGSGELFTSIAHWNAAWVKDPNKITAGMALLLFPDPNQIVKKSSIEEYLGKERLRIENFISIQSD